MIKDYFVLSVKNLKRRGVRSWLTLLGIFIGISAVIALISLGQGLRVAVSAQLGISSSEVITVQAGGLNSYGPPGSGAVNHLTTDDVDAISKLSSVERAIGRNIPSVKIEFDDKLAFSYTASVPYGDDRTFVYDLMEIQPALGRMLKDEDVNKVMLGYNFNIAGALFEKAIRPGNSILINNKSVEVIGILKKKGSFILDNVAYMNEHALEDLIGYGNEVDIIAVKIKSKDLMSRAKEEIKNLMLDRRNVDKGEEDFEVSTPEAAMQTVNAILSGIQAFIVLIATMAILVGAIGIVNTMGTAVLERKREIGIMKAVGAKNSDIFLQFFIEAGLLGLVGGIAGVIVGVNLGILGTLGINKFIGSSTHPQINFILIFGALLGSFIIGCLSGIIPAMKAARQNVVEAMRGE